jgi:hypothetical protein
VSFANFPHQYTEPNPYPTNQPPVNPVPALAYSPDSHILAVGTAYTSVTLWDVADPSRPHRIGSPLTGYTSAISGLAFSPDGAILAAAGGLNDTVVLWDVADPARPLQIGSPLTSQNSVSSVAFSPDGSMLAVGSGDGQTMLWDVAYPQQPMPIGDPLGGGNGSVTSVALSGGGILAVASADQAVRLWDESAVAPTYTNAVQLACDDAGPLSQAAWRQYLPGLPYIQPCQMPGGQPASSQKPASSMSASLSPSPAPSGSGAGLPPFQRTAAHALAKMLATVMSEQRAVPAAVNDVKACSDLPQDVNILGQATSFMQTFPGGLASIPDGWALPTQMLYDIQDIWGAEQQQYADFTSWASDEEHSVHGCSPDDTADPYYRNATEPDDDVTADKHSFVTLWNPIATQYRLTTYQWNQL